MTNPANAIRMLITYAVCIPLAILVGYLLTDPLDYGSLGLFGLIALILMSPIFIRWHYEILLFGLTCPAFAFFLKGNPPMWQVLVILSFGIAVVERAMNSERRFVTPAVMVWPLVFTVAMAYTTARLTGGIGLKALGGGDGGTMGGGKKYIEMFVGIMCFFALASRPIPVERRKLYIALYFLGAVPAFIGDLFPVLPGPFKYINLLIPPQSEQSGEADAGSLAVRLGSFGLTAGAIFNYLVARYGLRGILLSGRPLRFVMLLGVLYVSLLSGFRIGVLTDAFILGLIFFLEGLYRTRLLLVVILASVLAAGLVVPFAKHLPYSVQRSLAMLPLDLDQSVRADADGSTQWRHRMWTDLWPKVPQYLLLGKGYALTAEDFEYMGNGEFAHTSNGDASSTGLAVSGDYHNGPLSTLIPFGVWGAISMIWLLTAALYVTYRNFQYSVPELKTVNTYFFVISCWHVLCFCFVFGAYSQDIFFTCHTVGFNVALNWGIRAVKKPVASVARPVIAARVRRQMPPPPPKPQAA